MSFQLVSIDHELKLNLHFDGHIEESLVRILERAEDCPEAVERELGDLSFKIAEAISCIMVNSAIPPSEKQIKYAVAIARRLSLQLSAEVLQSREAMTAFLGEHAKRYRQMNGRR